MTGTSVVDYKYVDLVEIAEKGGQDEEESGVCNLRLLVHDDRMEEDSWVNARLAGQLWPGPVIQFYVDNIVLTDYDDDEEDDEGELDEGWWRQLLWRGYFLIELKYRVVEVAGTLLIKTEEWRKAKLDIENFENFLKEDDLMVDELSEGLGEIVLNDEDKESSNKSDDLKETNSDDLDDTLSIHDDEDEDNSSDEDEDDRAVLLFHVKVASSDPDHDKQFDVLLHLESLEEAAPRKLLDYLESKLSFTMEEEADQEKEESMK